MVPGIALLRSNSILLDDLLLRKWSAQILIDIAMWTNRTLERVGRILDFHNLTLELTSWDIRALPPLKKTRLSAYKLGLYSPGTVHLCDSCMRVLCLIVASFKAVPFAQFCVVNSQIISGSGQPNLPETMMSLA